MIITHKGLEVLSMVNSSCRVFGEKKIKNLEYLIGCAKSGKDFDFKEFEKNLPEQSFMYAGIKVFAMLRSLESVDEEVIWKFFGGADHVQYTLDQIRALNLREKKDNFANRFLFVHILTPVTITSAAGKISGVYKNEDIEVGLDNLVSHPCLPKAVTSGDKVLVHYAVIVGVGSPEIEQWLLKEQIRNKDFTEATKKVKNIDYASFWNLKEWT